MWTFLYWLQIFPRIDAHNPVTCLTVGLLHLCKPYLSTGALFYVIFGLVWEIHFADARSLNHVLCSEARQRNICSDTPRRTFGLL